MVAGYADGVRATSETTRPVSRRAGLVAAGALAAAAMLGGCAAGDGDAGPELIEEIQEPQHFYEGDYLGQEVTVSAVVTEVLGPRNFELAGRDYGEDSLLVQTPDPVQVEQGQRVRVTGTVGQFHLLSEDDYAPGSYDRYEKYETEAYVYDAVVEPVPA